MPASYEEFKKQYEAIKASVVKFDGEIDKYKRYVGQTAGVMNEGTKEIGMRVQELKDKGMKGTTIDAFMADPDVKTMAGEIQKHLAMMQKELLKATAMEADIKKMVVAFQDLKKDVTAEIAARKKQTSTKAGTGNKSLPDMEALLAEMKKYEDQKPYVIVEGFVPDNYSDHVEDLKTALAKEVTQAKDVALSAFQKQMQEQTLNTRVLNSNINNAKTWYATVMKQCEEGLKAAAAKQAKELAAAKAAIVKPWKDLQAMNDNYQDALADKWIAANLRDSKDKSTVENGVKMIAAAVAKAAPEVAKLGAA